MKRRTNPNRSLKFSMKSPAASLVVAANVAAFFTLGSGKAAAANIYWDGSGTSWAATASWSTALGATTPDPAAVPTTGDVAIFSISTLTNTAQTVNLNAAQSVLGLSFLGTNAGTTALLGGGAANQTLTLGTSGIAVESGAGAVTIGSGTNLQNVAVTLGAAQSWTNNSANALTVVNGVTNGGFLLTVGGSGNSALSGILAGTGGLTKTGAGTLTLSGANTFTGTTTVRQGTLTLDYSSDTSKLADATGILSFNGGTLNLSGGTHAEIVTNTAIAAGASSVTRTSGSATLVQNAITRTAGATIDYASGVATTTTINVNGILGGYATVGGADWAVGAGSIAALPSASYVAFTGGAGSATSNYSLTGTGATTRASSVNSLKIIANGAGQSLSLASGNLNFSTGVVGLMVTGTDAYSITGGSITNNNVTYELVVQQYNTGGLTISSPIADSSGSGGLTSLTKSGPEKLTLSGANTYTGTTAVTRGTLAYGVANALSSGAVTVNGGTLDMATFSDTVGAVTLTSGSITGTTGVLTGTSFAMDGTGSASAILAGAVTLTKTGVATTTTLSGANTYSVATAVNSGTLRATTSAAALGAGTLALSGGALELANDTGLSFGRNTTVSGAVQITSDRLTSGAGVTHTLGTLSMGAQTLTIGKGANATGTAGITFGATTLSASGATLAANSGTLLTLGAVSGNTFGFTVDGAGDAAITGIIGTTTGTVTKAGAGTLTLSGTNTFTGVTTLNGGILSVATIGDGGVAGNLGQATSAAANLVFGGGTLQYTGVTAPTNRAFTLGAGLTGTIDVSVSGTALTISGASAATTGGLTKTGAGTLVLSGSNAYTGVTTLNAGTLSVATIGNGGASGNLGAATNAAANLVFGGGTLQYTGATASTDRAFTLGAGLTGTIEVSANALTISGASAATTGGLTKTGAGTLVLSGSNAYTGITTLSAGTLSVATIGNGGASGNLGAAANIAANLVFDGGTLQYTGATASTDRAFTLGAGKTGTIEVSANALTISGASAATTGGLTKTGAGTLVLSGSNAYTGITTLSAGTLSVATIGNGGASGNLGAATNAAANLVLGGGTLQYTGATASTDRAFTLGAGTTGTIEVSANALTISGASASTNGALTKTGVGTLVLSGSNAHTGLTSVSAGVLRAASSTALGTTAGGVTVASGAALELDGTGGALIIGAEALTLNGSGISSAGGLRNIAGANSYAGAITLGSAAQINSDADTLTLSGGVTGAFGLTVGGAGNTTFSTGALANGAGGLTKAGAGILTLSGTNTYTGVTTLNAGTVSVATIGSGGASGNLGAATNAAANLVFGGGTLRYTGATASTDRSFTLGAGTTGTLEVTANSLEMTGASTATTGLLVKSGAGTLVLSGNNLHTGGTTLSAGTLRATTSAGALGAGILTLSGGTLQLANDTGLNFNRPTTITGAVEIASDRLTTGAGVTHTLSGLTMGAQTLSLVQGTSVSSGTAGLTFGTGTTFTGDASFNLGFGTELTFAQNTTGAVNLSKSGSGTLTMAAGGGHANVSISGGALNINHFQGLGTSVGTLTLGAGVTLNNTSGAAVTVGNAKSIALSSSLNFTGTNNLNLGSGTATLGSNLSVDVAGGTLGFGGDVVGAFGITKTGAGTLQFGGLSGTSSYSGNTVINAGTLELAGSSKFRSGTTIELNAGGTLLVGASASYDGATLLLSGGTLSVSTVVVGDVIYNSSATLTSSNANLNGIQTIRTGVTVATASDYLGTTPTTLTAGRIVIESGGTLQATAAFTLDKNKGIQLGTTTGTAAGSTTISSDTGVALFLPTSITGDAALVKTGAGNIRLIGDNSYRGGTVINAGIIGIFSDASLGLAGTSLQLNNGTIVAASPADLRTDLGDATATIGTARSLTLGVGTTNNMDAQTGRTLIYGGAIAEAGAGSAANLRFGNTGTRDGTVILNGANTYSGTTTLVAGTLEVASLANGGVASGIGDASSAAGNLVLNAGTLRYSGASASTDRLFTLGGSATLDSGAGTLNFTNAGSVGSSGSSARTLTLSGSGSGSLAAVLVDPDVSFATSLTKAGSGTWALSGTNTYTGATNVQSGTLAFSAVGALNTSSQINLGVAATSSGTLRYTGGAGTLSRGITILGNGTDTIENTGSGLLTLSGIITKNGNALKLDGGSNGILLSGSVVGTTTNLLTTGTVNLGAALPVDAVLQIGDGGSAATDVVLGSSGAAQSITVGGLTSSGTNNAIVGGNATVASVLTVNMTNVIDTNTYNGVLGGGVGATAAENNLGLTKSGAGTLVLAGSEANTYVGDTVVTGGVLRVNKDTGKVAIPGKLTVNSGTVEIVASGQLSTTSDIVVGAAGTFNFGSATGLTNTFGTFTNSGTFVSGANTFIGTGNSINLVSGSYTVSAGATVQDAHWKVTGGTNTVQGGATRGTMEVLSGGLGLEFDGTASPTITLNSDAVQAGRLLLGGDISVLSTVTAGTAQILSGGSASNVGYIDLGAATRTLTVYDGAASTDLLIAAAIANGGLTKAGSGTLTLSGANTFTGLFAVNAGVVDLQNAAALGSLDNGTNVASGAALQLSGGISLGAEGLTLSGSGVSSGGALRNISGSNSSSGSVAFGAATRINVDSGTLGLSGALSGSFGLTVGGAGRLKISGSNGSTTTNLDGTATLQIGDGGTTGRLGSGDVTMGSGTAMEFMWLTGTGVTVPNAISGAGALRAMGGNLTLTGANSYTGQTSITSGILQFSGSGQLSGTSSIVVAGGTLLLSGGSGDQVNNAAGITLGGGTGANSVVAMSGSVTETLGALTLTSGGGLRVIDFGTGSGILTVGSLASSGSGVLLQIWNWSGNIGSGGGTDRLIITSGVLGSNLSLSDITIFSDSGLTTVGTGEVTWGAGGELVAVPEARSVLASLLLLLPLAWRERSQWWRGAAARARS